MALVKNRFVARLLAQPSGIFGSLRFLAALAALGIVTMAAFPYALLLAHRAGVGLIDNVISDYRVELDGAWFPIYRTGAGLLNWHTESTPAQPNMEVLLFSTASPFFLGSKTMSFIKVRDGAEVFLRIKEKGGIARTERFSWGVGEMVDSEKTGTRCCQMLMPDTGLVVRATDRRTFSAIRMISYR